MKNLKVAELQAIAKAEGIALSYTKDGKRHKLNKAELIEAIEALQVKQAQVVEQVETVQSVQTKRTVTANLIVAQTVKTNAIIVSGENIKINKKQSDKLNCSSMYGENAFYNVDQDLNLNTLVKDSKRLLKNGFVDKVKSYVTVLNNKITLEKKNKLLVNRMSQIRNVLTALLKQNDKKVAAHA